MLVTIKAIGIERSFPFPPDELELLIDRLTCDRSDRPITDSQISRLIDAMIEEARREVEDNEKRKRSPNHVR